MRTSILIITGIPIAGLNLLWAFSQSPDAALCAIAGSIVARGTWYLIKERNARSTER